MAILTLRKLIRRRTLRRIVYERLTEPLHLNVMSAVVALFGNLRWKIDFDLIVRQQHAFALLRAADHAVQHGINTITALEFGVANGAGLLNMSTIARSVTRATGVEFRIVGFDSGAGMPPPRDYRDHPEYYGPGDFPMDRDRLLAALPPNVSIIFGDVSETAPEFLARQSSEAPIGFVSLDLDYYWSTKEALGIFDGPPDRYLPVLLIYLDDIQYEGHNAWAGELLAVQEFNEEHHLRKIAPVNFLRHRRLFKNAMWIDHMYALHVLDHPSRSLKPRNRVILDNPYLD